MNDSPFVFPKCKAIKERRRGVRRERGDSPLSTLTNIYGSGARAVILSSLCCNTSRAIIHHSFVDRIQVGNSYLCTSIIGNINCESSRLLGLMRLSHEYAGVAVNILFVKRRHRARARARPPLFRGNFFRLIKFTIRVQAWERRGGGEREGGSEKEGDCT